MLQPGTLVRWTYRVVLPQNTADDRGARQLADDARAALPQAGWEIRTRDNASPQLERTISRFTQFLTLVGLAALLVGGVGVANAVKSHVDRKRDVIAAFKALGATGRDVFAIYLTQVLVLAVIGSLIGLALGAALPYAIVGLFGAMLPLPVVPTLHPVELLLSLVYGLLTALAFGLWPLTQVQDVPVAALFREAVISERHTVRRKHLIWMARGDRSADRGGDRARLRQAGGGRLRAGLGGGVRPVARHRQRADGGRAQTAAGAEHHAAARGQQHPPARRADAVGGDVARARASRCWSPSPRSTAICAGNSWRRCRSGRRRSISSTSPPPKPTVSARS